MDRRRRPRATRGVRLAVTVLLAAIAGIIGLIVYARRNQAPERAKVAAVLAEAGQRAAAIRAALEEKRKNFPPESARPPALMGKRGVESQILLRTARGMIDNDGVMSQIVLDELRMQLEPFRIGNRLTPLLASLDPAANTPEQVAERFTDYLRTNKELKEIEQGIENGLYDELTIPDPHIFLSLETSSTVAFFAARALADANSGALENAVNTCVCLYRLGELVGSSRLCQGIAKKAQINADTDKVVWRIADRAPLSPDDENRLTAEIGKRLSWTPLIESLRYTAAFMESGQLWGRPRQDPFDAFFRGRYGRGSMQLAEAMIRLLENPSADTPRLLAELPNQAGRNGHGHPFIRLAYETAYKLHAKDIARAKAMYLGFILKAWKRGHGAYPTSLDELDPKPAPETWHDVSTGVLLNYERTPEGGFTIWIEGQAAAHDSGPGKGMPPASAPDGKREIGWEARN
ncbi:MAG TPA: hypothetical protein P5318_01320 [Candidatus Hydrogenedentes bacterium]|nr:hypothetical protein [Candidatus Hydrogenedentota bacterium]HRT18740.1 hypothetical protein [Candidatus Hydrogenedentota bacterium]HRT63760.1 hypothetical protein [Candidatus Hydrogenedentota bacterium]